MSEKLFIALWIGSIALVLAAMGYGLFRHYKKARQESLAEFLVKQSRGSIREYTRK